MLYERSKPTTSSEPESISLPDPDIPPIPLSPGKRLELLATIAAGLLASGQYHEDDGTFKSWDYGEDWEDDWPERRHFLAVSEDDLSESAKSLEKPETVRNGMSRRG